MNLIRYYRTINILSIDIALGAVVSALFLGKALRVKPDIASLLCLGITVWIIYTADHLLDARRIAGVASTLRHRFHQENFRSIFVILLVAIFLNSILLFFVGRTVLMFGGVLSLLVCLYFLFQRHLSFLKEGIGAILYTAGVFLPIEVQISRSASTYELSLITMFTITALVNLTLFSWYDLEHDKMDNQSSLSVQFGKRAVSVFLYLLFATQLSIAILVTGLNGYLSLPVSIVIGMNFLLFLIFKRPDALASEDRYRMAGDAVFIFPILFYNWL
ncbi:MAG: hypothetical protein RIB47_11780 [Cyclobacteriaceae bacterium]